MFDLKKAMALAADQGRLASEAMRISSFAYQNERVVFAVKSLRDVIQRTHFSGQFYEPEELEILRRNFKPGQVFCDVGTNVGNHTVYAMKIMGASRAHVFEPNPVACEVLLANLFLNGLEDRVDFSCLGYAVGAARSDGNSMAFIEKNIGGGRVERGGGDLSVRTGDDMLGGRPIDLMKIDVEGMEIDVLKGFAQTVATHRPSVFVEVDNTNRAEFDAWVAENTYVVTERFKRYRSNENFMIVPHEKTTPALGHATLASVCPPEVAKKFATARAQRKKPKPVTD